jgi:hypothetical protein
LLQAETVEPGCDVHTRLLAATGTANFTLTGLRVAREESARLVAVSHAHALAAVVGRLIAETPMGL